MSIAPGTDCSTNAFRRYDTATIVFHWLTAALVIVLFATAYWFNSVSGGTPMRKSLRSVHVSTGILFAVVFVGRLVWRVTGGRPLPAAREGASQRLSTGLHAVFYILLAAQIIVGFLFRWAQGETFTFFGWFAVPPLLPQNKPWSKTVEMIHNYAGWVIIILAGGPAVAALIHHFLLRDAVLKRKLPGLGAKAPA